MNDLDQSIVGWKRRKERAALLKRAVAQAPPATEEQKRQAVRDFEEEIADALRHAAELEDLKRKIREA